MVKFKYIESLKNLQNEDTIKLIGKIDIELLKSDNYKSLYYSLPLIERIVLEIYKLIPDADVEVYKQGTMRTILSVIDKNYRVLPENLIELIKKYYEGENCIRNRLFHPKNNIIQLDDENLEEINYLIMQLIIILSIKIKESSTFEFENIKYL